MNDCLKCIGGYGCGSTHTHERNSSHAELLDRDVHRRCGRRHQSSTHPSNAICQFDDVVHHADNFMRLYESEPPTDCTAVGPVLPNEGTVDERDQWCGRRISFADASTG